MQGVMTRMATFLPVPLNNKYRPPSHTVNENLLTIVILAGEAHKSAAGIVTNGAPRAEREMLDSQIESGQSGLLHEAGQAPPRPGRHRRRSGPR